MVTSYRMNFALLARYAAPLQYGSPHVITLVPRQVVLLRGFACVSADRRATQPASIVTETANARNGEE